MAEQDVRVEGLEGTLKTLRELPPEIVSRRGGPVRTALRNASKVMVEAAQGNVQRIIDEPNKGGYPTRSIGHLKDNIHTVRDTKNMKVNGERYIVRVRKKKYPQDRAPKQTVTAQGVAMALEAGTENRDPMPIFRPAYMAHRHGVIIEFNRQLKRQITRIQKKLARKNGVA